MQTDGGNGTSNAATAHAILDELDAILDYQRQFLVVWAAARLGVEPPAGIAEGRRPRTRPLGVPDSLSGSPPSDPPELIRLLQSLEQLLQSQRELSPGFGEHRGVETS